MFGSFTEPINCINSLSLSLCLSVSLSLSPF